MQASKMGVTLSTTTRAGGLLELNSVLLSGCKLIGNQLCLLVQGQSVPVWVCNVPRCVCKCVCHGVCVCVNVCVCASRCELSECVWLRGHAWWMQLKTEGGLLCLHSQGRRHTQGTHTGTHTDTQTHTHHTRHTHTYTHAHTQTDTHKHRYTYTQHSHTHSHTQTHTHALTHSTVDAKKAWWQVRTGLLASVPLKNDSVQNKVFSKATVRTCNPHDGSCERWPTGYPPLFAARC